MADTLHQRLFAALEAHHLEKRPEIDAARAKLRDSLASEPENLTPAKRRARRLAALARFDRAVARARRTALTEPRE